MQSSARSAAPSVALLQRTRSEVGIGKISAGAQVAEWILLLVIAVLPLDLYILIPGQTSGVFLSEVLAAEGFLLLALAILVARVFRRDAGVRLDPRALIPLGLILVVSLVSTIGAHSKADALRDCAQDAFFVGVYALAVTFAGRPSIRTRALVCTVVSFGLVVGFGLLGTVPGAPDIVGYVLNVQRDPATLPTTTIARAASSFRFPDELNAYLIFILPLLVACATKVRSQVDRIAYSLLAGLGFWLLILTYARSALLICVLLGPLLMFMLGGKRLGIAAAAVAVVVLGVLLLNGGVVAARLQTLLSTSDSGYTNRLATWTWAIGAFLHHPFLGVGPRNLGFVPGAPYANTYTKLLEDNAENSYLNVLATIGLAGGVALLVCIGGAFRRLTAAMRLGLSGFEQAWHIGLLVGLCALLLDSLVHSTFTSTQVTGLLCALVGLSSAGIIAPVRAAGGIAPPSASGTPIEGRDGATAISGSPASGTANRGVPAASEHLLTSRVVFLVNTTGTGGAEKHSLNLASELQRQGARVLVICPPRAAILPELIARGLAYRELHLGMNLGRVRGYLGTLALLNPFSRRASNRRLLTLAQEMPSTFVCPFPREQILTVRLRKRHDLRTVWILHSPLHYLPHRLLVQPLLVRRSRAANAIISVSRMRAQEAIAAGMPAQRVAVIPAAVENAVLAARPAGETRDPNLIVVISRLVKSKGVQHAIAAMPRILQACPNAKLAIVGSGRFETQLKRTVARLGLGDHVEFLGYLARPEALLRRASLLVFPSVDSGEAMPAVILEAYACGVPVVATPVGGVREIVVDETTGLLVWPGDHTALAEAVITLLQDVAYARSLGTNARAFVESGYTYELTGQQFLRVLSAVERSRTGAPGRASGSRRAQGSTRLLSHTALLVASKLLTAAVTALWTVLAARILVPTAYGDLMLCAGLADLGAILTDAGFTAVATRELAQARGRDVGRITGTLIYLKLGLGLVASLVTLALGLLLPFNSDVRALMFIFAPSLLFVSLSSLTLVFRARLQVRFVAAASVSVALVGSYGTLVAYLYSPQAITFAQVRLGITIAGAVFALAFVMLRYRPRVTFNLRIARRLSAGALPLGVALALNILFVRIDVPILALMTNSTQVAVYTSAYRILDLVTLVPVSAAAIALPIMAALRVREPRKLGSFMRQYLDLAVVGGLMSAVAVTLVSQPVLSVLYGGRYDNARDTLIVLGWSGGAAFVTNVFTPLAVALDRRRALVVATALGLVTNVGLNLLLIPLLGPLGAAYATLATELVVTAPLVIVAPRFIRVKLVSRPIVAACLATVAALVTLWVMITFSTIPELSQVFAGVVWIIVFASVAPRWIAAQLSALRKQSDELTDVALTGVSNVVPAARMDAASAPTSTGEDAGGQV